MTTDDRNTTTDNRYTATNDRNTTADDRNTTADDRNTTADDRKTTADDSRTVNTPRAGESRRTDGGRSRTESAETPMVTPGVETTVIARTITRLVVPIILVTALALLFQGHNRPGGGFIGAVLTATAVALAYVVFGLQYLQDRMLGLTSDGGAQTMDRHRPIESYRWLFAGGLALALLSGIVPMFLGFPFLTQAVAFVEHLPIYEELEVASALAFDVGVFFAVVGAVLTAIAEVGSE